MALFKRPTSRRRPAPTQRAASGPTLSLGGWLRQQPKRKVALWTFIGIALAGQTAIAGEALVRGRLTDDDLNIPTRFYARPIVFEPGAEVDRDRVERALGRLGYRRERRASSVGRGEYYLGSRTWTIGRRAFRVSDRLDPGGVVTVRVGSGSRVSEIRDADRQRLAYLALEPEVIRTTYGRAHEDRVPVRLADVPQQVVDAVLTIEDQHFFEHGGLDARRIAGAAIANVRARKVVEGASTLTQQLAKNLYLSPRRSPLRKLRELALAVTLERRHSKERILEAYLNQVYLGQDGALAVHGIGRAAQFYFGKDVSQLDLAEGALLAGIIRGPSLYAPFRHPDRAKKRRDLVLRLMHERDVIAEGPYRRAIRSRLGLRPKPQRGRGGRYFIDFVGERLRERHGRDVHEMGLSVFTTLDMDVQRAADRAVREGLARLERSHPRLATQDAKLQAALVAIDPRTGEILAMVGGRDYGSSQFNRAIRARRQPGSSFKPIVALAALSQPRGRDKRPFTLASLLEDKPLSIETPAGLWEPDNYDGRFRGAVTLREALERSLNVPFARLGLAVGPGGIVETARRLGIESRLYPVPSLALGASDVTPLEMTRAFGVLAAGGFRAQLHATLAVLNRSGRTLSRGELTGEQVFDPAEAYLVTSALRGAVERGTGRALRSLGYRGAVAAKSGTTNNFRDAWFIGYTPTLAVGVWVGFDDGRSIGLSGSRAALPIFGRFLVGALGRHGDGDFAMPSGIQVVEVDRETGRRAGWGCRGETEVFLLGTAPEESCSRYENWTRRYLGAQPGRSVDVRPLIDDLRRRFSRRDQ